jgi:4-methyl-5(b-hydroxyethyl)-thiazole monophosphate biosynthesis
VEIDTVSISDRHQVTSSHGIRVIADLIYSDIDPEDYDVLILPGGKLGKQNLEDFTPLVDAVQKHFEEGKLTCAICAAPAILGHRNMLAGRRYTCFPTFDEKEFGGEYMMELAVTDGNLITGRGMGATIEFSREILKKLVDEETLKKVEYGIQYEHTFREQC